jgi:hypothetical protein
LEFNIEGDFNPRARYNNDTLTILFSSPIIKAVEVKAMLATPTFTSADPALFNPETGRLDASRIAREINLPVATIADAIGKKAPSVRKHPDASSLQPELRRVYRIWVAVMELYAGNKKSARIFLNAPNPLLERQAPIEFIEKGDLAPLEALVDAMSTRQPA